MTRKAANQSQEDGKNRKRILKPVVEKRRRDRINQSLAELRSLLLSSTSDPRLQNPKIEKAEILDVAVEYLRKWTDRKYMSDDAGVGWSVSVLQPHLLGMENAGFQQCVSQLTGFVQQIGPAQRASLMEGLKHLLESWRCKADLDVSDVREASPPWFPCSPPSSPWFSPPFPSFCHFSFPPGLSPPSSNASPTLPHANLHPLTSDLPHGEASAANSSDTWRPWLG